MGISDFYPTFKEFTPESFQTVSFSSLAGWRVAVDTSIFLFKYVKSSGDDDIVAATERGEYRRKWLDGFIDFVVTLKRSGIIPTFVFDGPNPPIEKQLEQQRRRDEFAKIKARSEKLAELIEDVAFKVDERYASLDEKTQARIGEILPSVDCTNSPALILKDLVDAQTRLAKHSTPITKEHTVIAKEFLDIIGVGWIQADGEAEGLCSYLAVRGDVHAVMSEDTDVFLYGSPYLISKIDVAKNMCCVSRLSDIIDGAELTPETFRDMCIMMGVDYNERCKGLVPGKKKSGPIGPKGAYQLVKTFGTIENFVQHLDNGGECLKWKRCREIFQIPDIIPGTLLVPHNMIDVVGLEMFLNKHFGDSRGFDRIVKGCSPLKLKFTQHN